MKIYIVRHGNTLFNHLGRVQGWCDSPLTPLGIQQAKELSEYFLSIPLAAGYHSGSERALDTLDLILNDRPVPRKRDKRLKEVYFGDLEGARVKDLFPDGIAIPELFYQYGGEDRHHAALRFTKACKEMEQNEKGDVLVVSHGSVIRQFLEENSRSFFQMSKKIKVTRDLIPNCSVSVIEVQHGKIEVTALPKIL